MKSFKHLKKWIVLALVVAMGLSMMACSAQQGEQQPQEEQVEAFPPQEENPTPGESQQPAPSGDTQEGSQDDGMLYVADASLYRGTVTNIQADGDTGVGTVLTLEQAQGTNFGAPSLQFRITQHTQANFQLSGISMGDYLEVYYGGSLEDTSQPSDIIAVNGLLPAEMVNFNGVLKSIQPSQDQEGVGQLVMEELETQQEVVFHYDTAQGYTQFYLDMDSLKEGDQLNIYHRGVYTRSLPPQGSAIEVRPYAQ